MCIPCDFGTQSTHVLAAKTACFKLDVENCVTLILTYVWIGSMRNCDKHMDKKTKLWKVGNHIMSLRAASMQCNYIPHTVGGYVVPIKYLLH